MSAATPTPLLAERIKGLQAEARGLANEHVLGLVEAMQYAADLAEQVVDGGDAYPVGVRDIDRKFTQEASAACSTLQGLVARLGR